MLSDERIKNEFLENLILHPATLDEVRNPNEFFYEWNENLPFVSENYVTSIEKKCDKDFVILNLADIQCHDGEAYSEVGEFYEETIDKLVERTNPDLITLTGDNAFDAFAYLRLINFIESYNIPWAPVMGNADHTGLVSEFWVAFQLSKAKNCLFKCGPYKMGYGNYIINITENKKPVHTLFMMDTHHEDEMQQGSYDHFYKEQIEWYKWAVEGIGKENGKIVPSTVFMHIPVPEYQNAWNSIFEKETNTLKPPYDKDEFCKFQEEIGAPKFNYGFFDIAKELGSTKNMVCGHEHTNCFAINYEGINLVYAMKTGYGCYWEHKTHGGTTIAVNSNGETKVRHNYINPAESKIPKFLDWYNTIYLKNL